MKKTFFLCLFCSVSILPLKEAIPAQAVVDVEHISKSQKVLNEAKKQTETSAEVLDKTKGVLNGVEDLNETLGKPTEVGVNAFDWINSTTGSVNNALQACGIAGTIPPISGLKIPGLDLPGMDLSCMSSALEAVESGLFTFRKFNEKDIVISGTQDRVNAVKNNRTHYFPKNAEEVLKHRFEYKKEAVKNVLAGANRTNANSSFVNETQKKLQQIGSQPQKINDLMRIDISVGLAIYEQLKEMNATIANLSNMLAAERMEQFPPEAREE